MEISNLVINKFLAATVIALILFGVGRAGCHQIDLVQDRPTAEEAITYLKENAALISAGELSPDAVDLEHWAGAHTQYTSASSESSFVLFHRSEGPFQGTHLGINLATGETCGNYPAIEMDTDACMR